MIDLLSVFMLKLLHLRENKFHSLDGFSEGMVALQYLNLRMNKVDDYREVESKLKRKSAFKLIEYEKDLEKN